MIVEQAAEIQKKCLDKMKEGGLTPMERMDCFAEFETTIPSIELVKDFYDVWGKDYDVDMAVVDYKNPVDVANEMVKLVPDAEKRKELKILDIGAGTGVGGLKLKEAGFTNIDASDGSPGMLEVAKKLEVYKNVFPEVLVKGQTMLSIKKETYDVITSSGAFYPFHLQGHHIKCFLDVVKTNGLVVISACPHSDKDVGVRPVIQELAKDGVVQIIEEIYVPKWYREDDGTVWALKKLRSLE